MLLNRRWYVIPSDRSAPQVESVLQYQVRFLGFKGMVSVDESLRGQGIKLRLRPSMNKFKAHEEGGYLEIARAFYSPGYMHLNR